MRNLAIFAIKRSGGAGGIAAKRRTLAAFPAIALNIINGYNVSIDF